MFNLLQSVNPDHLFLGTHDDNMQDMAQKGRSFGFRPLHKLTEKEVVEIRRLYATGGITQRELGKKFGVSQAKIQIIVSNKGWRYL